MTTIGGTVTSGFGAATENLKKQSPLIVKEFPEIENCFGGTINLELDKGLLVLASDHRTRPIDWHPDHSPGEVFDFLRVQVEPSSAGNLVSGWLYIAHNSDHRSNLKLHEVMAPRVEISVGARCKIHIFRPCAELPYRQFPVVLVL
jgi:hypothetical protein